MEIIVVSMILSIVGIVVAAAFVCLYQDNKKDNPPRLQDMTDPNDINSPLNPLNSVSPNSPVNPQNLLR